MERFLRENRRALLGAGVVLMFAPLVGAVVVGWARVLPVLEFVMAILAGLLLLKAASVFFIILIRSLL